MPRLCNEAAVSVFQAKRGGDVFLVLDADETTVTLYATVETMLRPTSAVFLEYAGHPYYWAEETGMMYVLREVAQENYLLSEEAPEDVLLRMENTLSDG